ncbi:hypothetical protein [Saccharothrix hoggarensis]|uniref:SH3 domain-containing protein n=1 Tax=Saccharothrix hoggarensis TaxID=913853 RepID=A0ABW3QXA0_9PSEU
MRIVKTAVAVAALAVGLFAGQAAATGEVVAGNPPAGEVVAGNPPVGEVVAGTPSTGAAAAAQAPQYTAVTWHDVNIRICPSTTCVQGPGGRITARTSVGVFCWVHGQSVTDFGYTNDVWLNVGREGGGTLWSSAIYFVGDQYANLPASAECTDVP